MQAPPTRYYTPRRRGKPAYTWLYDAILEAMREIQDFMGTQAGIFPIDVAVAIEEPLMPSSDCVRMYMNKLTAQGKLRRISERKGYVLVESEGEHEQA